MITEARLRADVRIHEGLDRITCLRAPTIHTLVRNHERLLQMSPFDERDLVETTDPSFPGGGCLIVCRTPLLAAERTRKRQELLRSTQFQDTIARFGHSYEE
jgi:hypothetical protein